MDKKELEAALAEEQKKNADLTAQLEESQKTISELNAALEETKSKVKKDMVIAKHGNKNYQVKHGVRHEGVVYSAEEISKNKAVMEHLVKEGSHAIEEVK